MSIGLDDIYLISVFLILRFGNLIGKIKIANRTEPYNWVKKYLNTSNQMQFFTVSVWIGSVYGFSFVLVWIASEYMRTCDVFVIGIINYQMHMRREVINYKIAIY